MYLGGLRDELEKVAEFKDWGTSNLKSNAKLHRTDAEILRREGIIPSLGYRARALIGNVADRDSTIHGIGSKASKKYSGWTDRVTANEMRALKKGKPAKTSGLSRWLAQNVDAKAIQMERGAKRVGSGEGGGLRRFGRSVGGDIKDDVRMLGARLTGRVPLVGLTESRAKRINKHRESMPL